MTLADRMFAVTMAPIGLALGSGGVLTLDFALLGSWAASIVLILGLVGLDILREIRGHSLWSATLAQSGRMQRLAAHLHLRSRRAKRTARNLFCSGFITGAIACAAFAPALA